MTGQDLRLQNSRIGGSARKAASLAVMQRPDGLRLKRRATGSQGCVETWIRKVTGPPASIVRHAKSCDSGCAKTK